jgi:regulator of sirC expression with transglutaminase-like and TPR domain
VTHILPSVKGRPLVKEQDITDKIVALAALPDHKVQLAEAALTIARSEYPSLDASLYMERLNELAAKLRGRIEAIQEPEPRIHEMNRLLFEEEGFRGNYDDYYDPRNSFLNEVLDRKLGIPITLSIVYIEVGRRAGLSTYGIGFPGHFLAGLLNDKERIVIDPFNGGKILGESDCRKLLRGGTGGSQPFKPSFLEPAWPKQILVRLLRNLKGVYWHRSEELKALKMVEWVLILYPDSVAEVRERGLFYEAIGDPHGAIKDLERYLELSPTAEDEEFVRATIDRLKTIKPTIH